MTGFIEATNSYDPIEFLKENIEEILPPESSIQKISFSGFKKKVFHSNKRPKGVVTIIYKDELAEKELQLFVKQHSHALKVFNQMSYIYSSLSLGKRSHMPKPFICDDRNNVNFMECVYGIPLTYVVLRQLLLYRGRRLKTTFKKIGKWLNNYHNTSDLGKTANNEVILEKVYANLDKTSYFTDTEKTQIVSQLKNKKIKNKFLALVTPHNDFALRNVIFKATNDFKIIDWDAIYHEKFTTETPIWTDITSFVISLQSLQRFSPLVSKRQIDVLIRSFLKGYFKNLENAPKKKDIKNTLYIFVLSFYMGLIGDRPLPVIYKEKLGSRYIEYLRHNIVKGNVL